MTVTGLRGEIYDCKGRLLVGNSTSYNLLYEYGAMPDTYAEINKELLTILDAIERTESTHTLSDSYFPLLGTYPDVSYTATAQDPDSDEYFYLKRTLTRLRTNACGTLRFKI